MVAHGILLLLDHLADSQKVLGLILGPLAAVAEVAHPAPSDWRYAWQIADL